MLMSLQCKRCKSKNTKIVLKSDLIKAEKERGASASDIAKINESQFGVAANPSVLFELLGAVLEFFGKLFGFLEEKEKNKAKDKEKIVLCECGYWENF
ncbi:hypothetical protein C8322_13795 [Acinetobacter sp. SM1B]|nr:hypothetical protein C8322_13795 [Acinetobacter sp. SM1B]